MWVSVTLNVTKFNQTLHQSSQKLRPQKVMSHMLDTIAFSESFPGSVCGAAHVDHTPGAACRGSAVACVVALRPYVMHVKHVVWVVTSVTCLSLIPALLAEVGALASGAFVPVTATSQRRQAKSTTET